MAEEYVPTDVNRRSFLKAAVVTAAAATASGATAGILLKEKREMPVTLPEPPQMNPVPIKPTNDLELVDLKAQLAAIQAENSQLRVSLSSAQSQLDLFRRSESSQEQSALEAWRLQLDEANTQVATLSNEIGVLQGLLNLYEQLDTFDLAAIAGGGLAAVGGLMGDLADSVPSLAEGIDAGQKALTEFEEQLPQLKEGRQWLDNQVKAVGQSYNDIERALQLAVKAAGSFLHQLKEWSSDILKWLPFGIGDKASAILNAIADLLAEIPVTIEGLQTQIAAPLDDWLEDEGGEMRLQTRLIKPVREKALDGASNTVAQVQTLHGVYQTQLADPVEAATEHQQLIRTRIHEYRSTYSL